MPGSRWSPALSVLVGVFLVYLWHRNYNLIGDTFDYSIVTSAAGYLHEGLKPYRDFTTSLQSLTIYLAWAAEAVFGRRYVSLGYGNLLLALGFYAALLRLLKNHLPAVLRVLVAGAACAATYLQHGIIWYNSIGMSLLMLTVVCGAILCRQRRLEPRLLVALGALLWLSSMCKMNFHIVALAVTGAFLLLFILQTPPDQRRKASLAAIAVLVCGVVPGPILEIAVNGTSVHEYVDNVFLTPTSRFKSVVWLLNPALYLGKADDAYPDNWSGGFYLKGMLIYAGCIYLFFRAPRGFDGETGNSAPQRPAWLPSLTLVLLFGASLFLSVTNAETQMLTSSFLMIGLLAPYIIFGPGLSPLQDLGLKAGIYLMAGLFFVGGGASAFMHSRVRPGEPSWTDAMLKAMYTTKKFSALQNAVPFYAAAQINPPLPDYFKGTRFTGLAYSRMDKISAFVATNNITNAPQSVYWGPALQIMNSAYGIAPRGRFPLWYHLKVSVREEDAPRIIAAFQQNNYEWIVSTGWMREMPEGVRAYITNNYTNLGDESLLIFRRKGAPDKP